jgi:molybdopterin/thiamine biosynthesis adenylyltransferase
MNDRYSRQSFLGANSEALFQSVRAGIVGLGGGGSHIAQQSAHVGIGRFALLDPDATEFPNLNRTVGATFEDAISKTPKVIVAERMIKGINPYAEVWPIQSEWQKDFESLRACDVVFGCLDGFSRRAQLEESCRRAMIPLIDIGMDVHKGEPYSISGQVVVSIPGKPCFKCLGFIRDKDLDEEGRRYGEAGGNPQVVWSNGVLASAAVGMFIQMLTPWCRINPGSTFLGYDGDRFTLEHDSRFAVAVNLNCEHFASIRDLGDPFWKP